jgi:hypothetical protein
MTPGQAAYEAYAKLIHGYDAGFRYSGLSDESRVIWEGVAKAVIDQHIIDSDGDCSYDDWERLTGRKPYRFRCND